MSEEEKKLFEAIKYKNKHLFLVKVDADFLINLIEKQQKELNNLKEIEKSHQEENGKLRVELEQYKLLEANIDKANKIITENKFDEGLYGLLMQEKEKDKNTGKLVKNKIDGTIGIVLREWETGQVQVLEKIQPKVINTHDSWKTLELIEESDKNVND